MDLPMKPSTHSMIEKKLREHLRKLLEGKEAHTDWKVAFGGVAPKFRGVRPAGAPHSLWELLEHMRIAQWDILEFSRNSKHVSPDWPGEYWPPSPKPRTPEGWEKSLKMFGRDLQAMRKLVENPKTNLFAPIPHGSGQTILREALLIADHNAYHIGQAIMVRRLLGAWK
jgi:DinB superfamily